MRRTLAFAVVLGLGTSIAAAQSPPTRDQVRELLTGIEHVPSDADWRRIGDRALPILIELYGDRAQPGFVRLRAVGAVAAFPEAPATRTFLLAVARLEGQGDLFVREAVRALARGFGERAADDLVPFLDHREPVVREAVVRALAPMASRRAQSALRTRMAREQDPLVIEAWHSLRAASPTGVERPR